MKKIKLFILIFPVLFIQCEKDKTGTGNYIISISNYTQSSYSVQAKLDGVNQGTFIIQANMSVSWSVTSPCDNLTETAGMENVRIFTLVPNGSHTLELIDNSNEFVMISKSFELEADECQHQPFFLN